MDIKRYFVSQDQIDDLVRKEKEKIMTRPQLRQVPMPEPFPPQGEVICTMSVGQWDTLLDVCYNDNWLLMELDADEQPVAFYKKTDEFTCHACD